MVTEPTRVRIVLADDHEWVRAGLETLLGDCEQLEIVGLAGDGEEVLKMAQELRPDVILMDINMPYVSGIEATRQVKQQQPEIKIVGLSAHTPGPQVEAMREAGADAFAAKGEAPDELCELILKIHQQKPTG